MFKNYTLRLPSVFRYLLLLSITILISLSRSIPLTYADPSADLTVQIQDDVQLAGVTRFGINLGAQDQYGAAQLLKNLVINPGFEAGEHQMLFNVAANPEAWHVQADNWDTAWNNPVYQIGQAEGYWKRGSYLVLSGPTRGRTGPIGNFTYENNLYTFTLDGGTKPEVGDVFVVRKEIAGYNGDSSATAVADPYNNRPNTVGKQSLKLKKSADSSPSFRYIMDSFYRDSDRTAGKLVIADGKWHFEIWAKSEVSADTLEVKFYRDNEATFFDEKIPLTNQWQKIERDFEVAAGSDSAKIYDPAANVSHPVLLLTLNNRSTSSIWVDDIALQRPNTDANPTVFNDILVERLKALHPGVLRDWGEQLGSSLDNQLSVPMARKMTAYGPDKQVATNFHYSLPEFLQLAELIGADPWYVIPTSFSDAEINNLIAYLSAPVGSHPYADLRQQLGRTEPWTTAFETIHLELGNELWGSAKPNSDPFVGGTVRGGVRTAEVANATYAAMRANQWFDANRFDLIIGSQHAYPGRTQEIESNSSNHDRIGIAPYFGRIETWNNDEELYYPLFASAIEAILPTGKIGEAQSYLDQAGQGSSLAIYEINLHSSAGSADLPIEVRNKVVTSLAAGIALPFHMMTYQQAMGIRTQAMWRAAEYGFRLSSGDYVHLSGGLRDIEVTGRKRPSWLGLELVNKAIGGDLITTNFMSKVPTYTQSPFNGIAAETNIPLVNAFTYKNEGRYATVLFNLDLAQSHAVSFQLPFTPAYAAISTLANNDLFANNESAENVQIATKSGAWTGDKLTLPAHSITVVEWSTTPIILTPTVSPTPFPIPSTPTLTATPFVPSTPTTTPTPTATPFFPSTPTTTSTPIATATVPSTPTATPTAGVPTAVTMKSAETATLSTLLFVIPLSLIVATVGIYRRRPKRFH